MFDSSMRTTPTAANWNLDHTIDGPKPFTMERGTAKTTRHSLLQNRLNCKGLDKAIKKVDITHHSPLPFPIPPLRIYYQTLNNPV